MVRGTPQSRRVRACCGFRISCQGRRGYTCISGPRDLELLVCAQRDLCGLGSVADAPAGDGDLLIREVDRPPLLAPEGNPWAAAGAAVPFARQGLRHGFQAEGDEGLDE